MKTVVERLTRGASPISTALLASWLRIDSADELAETLTLIIDNASDMVQEWTGRSVMDCKYRKQFEHGNVELILPYPYIDTITVLKQISDEGVETDITDYDYDEEGRLDINTITTGRIFCEYTTTALGEASIKLGVLMVAAYIYEHRGDTTAKDPISESGAMTVLSPYRRVFC